MAGRKSGKANLSVVGSAPSVGHNSGDKTTAQISDEQMQALTRQHAQKRAKLVEAEKKAKADRLNFDKIIKSDLGADGLKNIKLLEDLETPEGEARVKAEIDRQLQVARWAGLPIGTQGSLWETDRRPITERAYDEGKRAGMDGKTMEPPHQQGTEAYGAWVQGWTDGQAVLAGGFKKPASSELLRNEDKKNAGPDDFDAAADGSSGGGKPEASGGAQGAEGADEATGSDGKPAAAAGSDGEGWPDDQAIAGRKSAKTS